METSTQIIFDKYSDTYVVKDIRSKALEDLQEMVHYYQKEKQKLKSDLTHSLTKENEQMKIYKKMSVFNVKLIMIHYSIHKSKNK